MITVDVYNRSNEEKIPIITFLINSISELPRVGDCVNFNENDVYYKVHSVAYKYLKFPCESNYCPVFATVLVEEKR